MGAGIWQCNTFSFLFAILFVIIDIVLIVCFVLFVVLPNIRRGRGQPNEVGERRVNYI
ncbi:P6 [Yam asymptomatic virus 1]|uniref:P6 n=1 Tax=Yam asymptomatic virus 1 TaxID=2771210 RepID=A0A7H1JMH5_9CLOS|nr:P6 [Yam asymptomatic virus 1]QNT12722.1 P6 [Yam asymptomatic virus 1]